MSLSKETNNLQWPTNLSVDHQILLMLEQIQALVKKID